MNAVQKDGTPCPKCKRLAVQLLSISDDGKGKRYCRDCKRKIRKLYPSKDWRYKDGRLCN